MSMFFPFAESPCFEVRPHRRCALLLACLVGWGCAGWARADAVSHFESKVRPLLIEKCVRCHGAEKQRGGLRLDSGEALSAGADTGPVVVPGKPEESGLIKAVQYQEEVRMPPDGRLKPGEVEDLIAWVRQGAVWPGKASLVVRAANSAGTDASELPFAFHPMKHPDLPSVADPGRAAAPIDLFILAELERSGLAPAPPAGPRELVRRVTFDLTGLPPPPEQVAEFLADDSPEAYARLVERLLGSPAYAEHWAREWLDAARYSDSNGLDENVAYEFAFRYRDYVIASFSEDKPYDRFLTEQIAGDLLGGESADEIAEHLTATGFLAVGPKSLREVDAKKMEMDIIDEQVSTIGQAVLGLTLGCARCHDHKFDPITTEDYYALAGIFKSTRTMKVHGSKSGVGDGVWLERELPGDPPVLVMAVTEGKLQNIPVHLRGNHLTQAEQPVPRGVPRVLAQSVPIQVPDNRSGRLELARWLTNPEHPLTARVMVNRVWQRHFGQGLVRTADNFGRLGEAPSHPELLDWLARRFIESGWSFKSLHREIVLSRTYKMSTEWNARAGAIDPTNRKLWRMNRRRLPAEAIRDALLHAAGELDPAFGGQLMTVKNRASVTESKTSKHLVTFDSRRRSVYLPVIRNVVFGFFQVFDFPDPTVPAGGRSTTTVPPQALAMMNHPLVVDCTTAMANRLMRETASDDASRVEWLFQVLFARPPAAAELDLALEFVHDGRRQSSVASPDDAQAELRVWQGLCQSLVTSNEFLYLD